MKRLKTQIIAHRGASRYAPENTMPAFELAYEMGAHMIEFDVHLSKDLIPVIIHDEDVKRTTNGTGLVRDLTIEELKQLDAGSWFSPKFSETRISTLNELLIWLNDKELGANIELKNDKYEYQNIEGIVYDLLKEHQALDKVVISTFNINSIKRLQQYKDELNIALLTSKKRTKSKLSYLIEDLEIDAIHFKYNVLNHTLMKVSTQYNIDTRVYTVNKPAHMLQCFKYKCTGVITDVPDIALEQFVQFNSQGLSKTNRRRFWLF